MNTDQVIYDDSFSDAGFMTAQIAGGCGTCWKGKGGPETLPVDDSSPVGPPPPPAPETMSAPATGGYRHINGGMLSNKKQEMTLGGVPEDFSGIELQNLYGGVDDAAFSQPSTQKAAPAMKTLELVLLVLVVLFMVALYAWSMNPDANRNYVLGLGGAVVLVSIFMILNKNNVLPNAPKYILNVSDYRPLCTVDSAPDSSSSILGGFLSKLGGFFLN